MAFTAATVSQEPTNINHTNQRSAARLKRRYESELMKHLNTSLELMKRNKSDF